MSNAQKAAILLALVGLPLVLMFFAGGAGPDLVVPELVEVVAGKPGTIVATCAGTVSWNVESAGLDEVAIDGNTLRFRAPRKAGERTVRVSVLSPLGERLERVVRVVVVAEPGPPVPEGLTARLQAAYGRDAQPTVVKRTQRNSLIGIYEAAQDHARNPIVETTGALLDDIRKTAAQLLVPAALTELRAALGEYVAGELGTDPATRLNEPLRAKAVQTFARVATVLGEIR